MTSPPRSGAVTRDRVPGIPDLRRVCQPSTKVADTIILAHFFRFISIYVTAMFLRAGLSANRVSVMSLLFGLAGSVALATMRPWYVFTASVLLFVHVVLDFVDGEVARYRGAGTLTGRYLDDVHHAITIPFLLVAASFGVFAVFQNVWILLLGCVAAVCEPLGQLVHWGFPTRIVHSELESSLAKLKDVDDGCSPTDAPRTDRRGVKELVAKLFVGCRMLLLRSRLIQKLYDKLWLENRIVNIIVVVGLLTPMLARLEYPHLHTRILAAIVVVYGVNRPLVLVQSYLARVSLENRTVEYEMNEALSRLREFKPRMIGTTTPKQ